MLVTPQFTLNALANFTHVLRLASDEGDASGALHCQYDLMSASGKPERASCGYRLSPTAPLIPPLDLDYVGIVGGLLYRGHTVDPAHAAYLKQASEAGVPLIGICTGAFILCRLGLMRDRKTCISWFHHRDFVNEFRTLVPVSDALYTFDRDRITTSGGVGAAIAAAALVERHIGREVAQKALRIMQINPPIFNLQPAPPTTPVAANAMVRRALLMMEQHLGHALSVQQIADRLTVSRQSLERQFQLHCRTSPKQHYLNLRLQQARILRQAGHPWRQVADETGFATSAHL